MSTRLVTYATRVARLGSCSSTIELHPHDGRFPIGDVHIPCDRNSTATEGGWTIAEYRAIGHPPEVCPACAVGRSFHPLCGPLQTAIRFFRHPLPSCGLGNPCGLLCRRTAFHRERRHKRLTTFHTSNRMCEDSAFPPVVLIRLRVPTKQQHNRPLSVLEWA